MLYVNVICMSLDVSLYRSVYYMYRSILIDPSLSISLYITISVLFYVSVHVYEYVAV